MKKEITPSRLILFIVMILVIVTLGSASITLLTKATASEAYDKARNVTIISLVITWLSYGIYRIIRRIENHTNRKDEDSK